MSKVMNLVLEDEDMLELMRILLDDDAAGALEWLKAHLSGKAPHVLEDRSSPKHPRA
jgi:hypothetical protein